MSKVFHYKQKLESLVFMKKYAERSRELGSKLQIIIECCSNLLGNQSILQLLKIVLCLGNFMNQGRCNGIAVGFSVSNLNKLVDIKSSEDKSFSMLHFLIETFENKVRTNGLMNLFVSLT